MCVLLAVLCSCFDANNFTHKLRPWTIKSGNKICKLKMGEQKLNTTRRVLVLTVQRYRNPRFTYFVYLLIRPPHIFYYSGRRQVTKALYAEMASLALLFTCRAKLAGNHRNPVPGALILDLWVRSRFRLQPKILRRRLTAGTSGVARNL